ncbi:MAG TPA: alpha/beta hydrolase [Anaeromyxobacter sp.]|nr:alpha/beta hydrolase [Anaeromyxobacter sp.]
MESTATDLLGPVLTLPGLWNSGPEHWQSQWERLFPAVFRRVEQREWERPALGEWVGTLDAAVTAAGPRVLLAAHSLACALVCHWAARHARAGARVRGALLVAPSDVEAPSYPSGPTGFDPMPVERLPFPSVVVASDDDTYVTPVRARAFAAAWGSRLVEVRGHGHLNSASRLGSWPLGLALLRQLGEGPVPG